MFGFLRRSRKPVLRPPLQRVAWDGRGLDLAFDLAMEGGIALELDGSFFDVRPPDTQRAVRFEFAFAPGGHGTLDLLPRRGRDGPALAAQPLRVSLGKAGVGAARDAHGTTLAPLKAGARLVPFGFDVAAPEVMIVVPVYNAPGLVARCLDSVIAHTRGRARLAVIDDASTDPAIATLLKRYAGRRGIRVLHNASNRGFTATANRGIAEAGGADVVLLNADTEVGPNWLAGLRRAAYSDDDVATATAVSDNAGAFSVPELEQANALPAAWTPEQCARALWQRAGLAYPELPTGNGFCLYIRRSVLDRIGVFDETAFAQGYGEENDFCMRAGAAGLRHRIAGNVFVRHARSVSFGEQRRVALGHAGMAVLRERWPQYEDEVGRNLFSFERRVLDWRVRRIFAAAGGGAPPRPRLLWVGAGAPDWTDAEVWNLRANGAQNELVCAGEVVSANTWNAQDAEASYRALWDWLQLHAIECLLMTERKDSAAEILCRLLDIPVALIDATLAPTARAALRDLEPAMRSFPEHPA